MECDIYAHGIDVPCLNMALQRQLHKRLALFVVDHEAQPKQYGVVTRESVDCDELLCEYLGEVRLAGDFDSNSCYVIQLDDDLFLDATSSGTIARYVNHSCNPNCEFRCWYVPCGNGMYLPRIGLYALGPIAENDVITADYRMMSPSPKSIRCGCGARACRQFIDMEPGIQSSGATADDNGDVSDSDGEGSRNTGAKRATKSTRQVVTQAAHKPIGNEEALTRQLATAQERITAYRGASPGELSSCPPCDDMLSHGVFLQQGWKFAHLDPTVPHIVNEFNHVVKRYHGTDQVDMKKFEAEDDVGQWAVGMLFYGRLFIGKGQSKVLGRRAAVLDCLACLQLGAALSPEGPVSMSPPVPVTESPAVCAQTLEDVCIRGWTELRIFRAEVARVAAAGNAERPRQMSLLSAKLVAAIHSFMPSPHAMLQYMGVDLAGIHQGMGMVDPAGKCLVDRNKRLEIGTGSRIGFADKGYIIFRTYIGKVLAQVGPCKRYNSVSEALREHHCTVADIVDEAEYRKQNKCTPTEETLAQYFVQSGPRSRQAATRGTLSKSGVYACAIHRVLWPLRQPAEVEYVMEILGQRLADLFPSDLVRRMRLGITTPQTVQPHVAMSAVQDSCLSSALAATTMGLSHQQYMADRQWARTVVREGGMSKPGFLFDQVPDDTWQSLRRVYINWRCILERDVELLEMAHREIQWGVDEWTCTGANPEVNNRFYNAIVGTSISATGLSMPPRKQGLSAIAMVDAGRFLQIPEYRQILLAEATTNDQCKYITVSGRTFMSTDPGQPSNVLHLDDLSTGSIFWTAACNKAADYAPGYTCTWAATTEGQFDTTTDFDTMDAVLCHGKPLREIETEYPGIAGALKKAYGAIVNMLPHELEQSIVPMGSQCVGGWSVYTRGPLLHGSPGTRHVTLEDPNYKSPRVVYLQTLTIGDQSYCDDCDKQLYYTILYELYHGRCSFLFILHVVDLALVQGLNIGSRMDHSPLGDELAWGSVDIMTPWSRGHFVTALIKGTLLVLVPSCAAQIVSSTFVLPGDVKRRKRQASGVCRKTQHIATFNRADVSFATCVVWRYLNAQSADRDAEIRSLTGSHAASWRGWGFLQSLVKVYRLYTGHLPVEGEVEGFQGTSVSSEGYAKAVTCISGASIDYKATSTTFNKLVKPECV